MENNGHNAIDSLLALNELQNMMKNGKSKKDTVITDMLFQALNNKNWTEYPQSRVEGYDMIKPSSNIGSMYQKPRPSNINDIISMIKSLNKAQEIKKYHNLGIMPSWMDRESKNLNKMLPYK